MRCLFLAFTIFSSSVNAQCTQHTAERMYNFNFFLCCILNLGWIFFMKMNGNKVEIGIFSGLLQEKSNKCCWPYRIVSHCLVSYLVIDAFVDFVSGFSELNMSFIAWVRYTISHNGDRSTHDTFKFRQCDVWLISACFIHTRTDDCFAWFIDRLNSLLIHIESIEKKSHLICTIQLINAIYA